MIQYLALGDSYTIGEQVISGQNFPNQLTDVLRKQYSLEVKSPDIIAQTGWTTDELMLAIQEKDPGNEYDLVTLLIGVNNQYRGRTVAEYEQEFRQLVLKAIALAGARCRRVFVLSIPDWGRTPFAQGKDVQKIASEIDQFNEVCRALAAHYGCAYVDITDISRGQYDASFLTPDLLHYNETAYRAWVQRLAPGVAAVLKH